MYKLQYWKYTILRKNYEFLTLKSVLKNEGNQIQSCQKCLVVKTYK